MEHPSKALSNRTYKKWTSRMTTSSELKRLWPGVSRTRRDHALGAFTICYKKKSWNKSIVGLKMCVMMERREALKFNIPSSLMIAGPSGCGKPVFTTGLLLDSPKLFETPPNSIHFFYGSWKPGYETLEKGGIQFHEGIPDSSLLPKWFLQGAILVVDDSMVQRPRPLRTY